MSPLKKMSTVPEAAVSIDEHAAAPTGYPHVSRDGGVGLVSSEKAPLTSERGWQRCHQGGVSFDDFISSSDSDSNCSGSGIYEDVSDDSLFSCVDGSQANYGMESRNNSTKGGLNLDATANSAAATNSNYNASDSAAGSGISVKFEARGGIVVGDLNKSTESNVGGANYMSQQKEKRERGAVVTLLVTPEQQERASTYDVRCVEDDAQSNSLCSNFDDHTLESSGVPLNIAIPNPVSPAPALGVSAAQSNNGDVTDLKCEDSPIDSDSILILQNSLSNALVAKKQVSLNLKHFKMTNSTLQQKLAQLSNQLHGTRSENNRLHAENSVLKKSGGADVSFLESETNVQSQDHIKALQSANQQLQQQLASEINNASNVAASFKSQNSALHEEVTRLANLVTQRNYLLNGKAREVLQTKSEQDKYRELMENKVSGLEGKIEAFDEVVDKLTSEKTAVQSGSEKLKLEVAELRKSNDELRASCSSKDEELAKVRGLYKDQEKVRRACYYWLARFSRCCLHAEGCALAVTLHCAPPFNSHTHLRMHARF